ncbi:unnamed protein product [Paramecium sonneborni]|uniref:Uncharacterized protein n=1 Tax=Paramecium sonneborni TaxID=65129 RepID=A0A8S1KJ05_9CILI|nr:unnamed protein product [Paramecium sonneborni]
MKGQQNYKIICQKLNCNESQLNDIDEFENNPYLIRNQQPELGFILYKIPQSECVSLKDLFDAIKSKYIVIFKGQAILIIQAILQHLLKMIEKKIAHCYLNLNNIFIKLNNQSNKFTTYQSQISIEKIYFIQYWCIQKTLNEELNYSNDLKAIKLIITQFLELYQDQRIQSLIHQISSVRNLILLNDCRQMNEIVNTFIREYVNKEKQTMRDNEIENYQKFNKQRCYYEKELLIYLNEILQINIYFGDQIIEETVQEKQEQIKYLSQTQKIQQQIQSYFQTLFLKYFQNYYGDKLENSYLIFGNFKKFYQEFLYNFREKLNQRANRVFDSINRVIEECFNQSKQNVERFNQDVQFQINYFSKEQIMEIVLKYFIKYSLEYDLSIEEQYKKMNKKILDDFFRNISYYMKRNYKSIQQVEQQ